MGFVTNTQDWKRHPNKMGLATNYTEIWGGPPEKLRITGETRRYKKVLWKEFGLILADL